MALSALPRAQNRRIAAATAVLLGAALLPALMITSAPAAAATPCVPAGYTATGTTDLLALNLLDARPLGLLSGPLANVTIGHATADMAHAQPRTATASADYLSATLAGIAVPPALLSTHARQSAPPSHSAPDSRTLLALHSGVLSLGAGNVSAQAGPSGPYACGLATGSASIVDATAVPGAHGRSLLALPTNLNGKAGAGLTTVGGHLGSEGGAAAGLADLQLFAGTPAAVGVRVITEPTLLAIAGGTAATSSVSYTSPVLDVALPGGRRVSLSDTGGSVSFGVSIDIDALATAVPDLPVDAPDLTKVQLQVRISLGALTKTVTPTSVSASAVTLRVQVLLAPVGTPTGPLPDLSVGDRPLLDLGIGELSVSATAPVGTGGTSPCDNGYGCRVSPWPCATGGGYGGGYATCTPSPSGPSGAPSPGSARARPRVTVSARRVGRHRQSRPRAAPYSGPPRATSR